MFRQLRKREMLESTEHSVSNQARAIQNNGWLSELELKAIKWQAEDEYQGELCKEQDLIVEAEIIETDVETVEEKINDAEDRIGDTEGDLREEHRTIVEQLNEITMRRRTNNRIITA